MCVCLCVCVLCSPLLIRDRHSERHWQRYRAAFINCLLVLLFFWTLFLAKVSPGAGCTLSLPPFFRIDCSLKRFYMFCSQKTKPNQNPFTQNCRKNARKNASEVSWKTWNHYNEILMVFLKWRTLENSTNWRSKQLQLMTIQIRNQIVKQFVIIAVINYNL